MEEELANTIVILLQYTNYQANTLCTLHLQCYVSIISQFKYMKT